MRNLVNIMVWKDVFNLKRSHMSVLNIYSFFKICLDRVADMDTLRNECDCLDLVFQSHDLSN